MAAVVVVVLGTVAGLVMGRYESRVNATLYFKIVADQRADSDLHTVCRLKSFTVGMGYKLGLIIPVRLLLTARICVFFLIICIQQANEFVFKAFHATSFCQICIHLVLKCVYFSCCLTF